MNEEQKKQGQRPLSPMGAAAMLHAWLAFRLKLDKQTVANCAGALYELIEAANKRADILGWLDTDEYGPEADN